MVTPKIMNISFQFFMLVGPDQRKKRLNFGKDQDHILDTNNPEFLEMTPVGIITL